MKYIKILYGLFLTLVFFSCTKLEEKFRGELDQNNTGNITAAQLLISAYGSLNGPFQEGDLLASQQVTTDETIVPTRGPDWDDNGQWRALFAHTWNADQGQLRGAFTGLLSAQFAASNVLQFSPSAQQAAEARFIRALSMYWVLDGWDQVPYRADLTNYKILPETLKGTAAADFIISELNAIIGTLPDTGPAYVANKNAARALLMKIYLNYGVYANRVTPTFPKMTEVITFADQIIASNKYSLTANFFDNFSPDNDVKSTENIYTLYNDAGDNKGGNVRGSTYSINHYNMNPGGWNGWSTLSDFYNKFGATDKRRGAYYTYPGALPNPGQRVNIGFLIGQQYNLTTDAPLNARSPATAPLSFTSEVSLRETNAATLEVRGIRVNKYAFDYANSSDQKDNDWTIFRYADVLLMKAEALVRSGGSNTTALELVNQVRRRGHGVPVAVPNVLVDLTGTLTLNQILDERGRELYWEGYRRQDLIRFGKFLQEWQEKPADGGTKNLLFPIPSSQLAVNPNLTQNPDY